LGEGPGNLVKNNSAFRQLLVVQQLGVDAQGFSFGGVARHLVYDNLASAVAEHHGRVVRFQPRFLTFAREYGFCPRACNPAAPWEKGKTERAIGYIRSHFWPRLLGLGGRQSSGPSVA
jgi:hypothetical protein